MKKVKEKICLSVQSSLPTSKSTSTGLTELLHNMTIEGTYDFVMALGLYSLSCVWSQFCNMPNNAAKIQQAIVFLLLVLKKMSTFL